MTSRFAAPRGARCGHRRRSPPADLPDLFGIPVDFILFGLTLAGVALFHHYTLQVALTGLAVITLYKLAGHRLQDRPGLRRPRGAPGARVGDPREPLRPARRLRHPVEDLRGERGAEGAAALSPRRLEGLLHPARHGVRPVVVPRQHRRGADRRRDGAHRVPRQGPHRLSRGDRRGVERGRRGQRGRRHDDDDDVDRRREPARGARRLRRGVRRAGRVRHSGGAAAAEVRADHEGRAAGHARRLGARGHRRVHPARRDRRQRRHEPQVPAGSPTTSR